MTTSDVQPRLCHLVKGSTGYGFHLFGAKNSSGHSIRKVEEESPASASGLLVGDKIIAVNGVNVQDFKHAQVVAQIKENPGQTRLLVIDEEGEKYCKENNITITEDMVTQANQDALSVQEEKVEVAETAAASEQESAGSVKEEEPAAVAETAVEEKVEEEVKPRPRLCKLVKQDGGYGFNLHSEKGSSGKTVSLVEPGGAADVSGLLVHDRLVEVNGVNMESERHSRVVQAIKDSGDSVELLVVDAATDNYYLACGVSPSSEHLTGPVPDKSASASARKTAGSGGDEAGGRETSDSTTEFTQAILSMDLSALKAKVSAKRKQAPATNWGDRKAIFNNF